MCNRCVQNLIVVQVGHYRAGFRGSREKIQTFVRKAEVFAPVLEYWLLRSKQLIPHRPSTDVDVRYCARSAVDFVGDISQQI